MRRVLLLCAVVLLACRAFAAPFAAQPSLPTLPSAATPAEIYAPAATSPLPSETAAPTDLPAPAVSATPASPSTPAAGQENPYTVRLHPDGRLFVGDRVSIEVIAPPGKDMEGASAIIQVGAAPGEQLGPEKFAGFGIANRPQATFTWAWDTRGLSPGDHTLSISILPEGTTWTEIVTLHPQSEVPPPEPGAHWAAARNDCCVLHYITGTRAERDLPLLLGQAAAAAAEASTRLDADFTEPITITLIPRVLGHGGFANNEISISYPDRNYAGSQFEQVLLHEMIHILDARLGGDLRPTMLVEGLAVYLAGGHFKPEPLLPRAAALLALPAASATHGQGWYLPLQELIDHFYPAQHEIGYLEAGAFVEYLVNTWGWEAFNRFYRDIHPHPSHSQSRAVDQALQGHFGLSLAALEKDFLAAMRDQAVETSQVEDVRLTVSFYNTVRRYQQLLDPSAYFQTAWLLDNQKMRQQGIVADYLRHPSDPVHVALETLLVAANDHLLAGNYDEADKLLQAVNAELDEIAPNLKEETGAEYFQR